jgi:hypothetical protein
MKTSKCASNLKTQRSVHIALTLLTISTTGCDLLYPLFEPPVLSYRQPTSAGISRDSYDTQDNDKRNTLYVRWSRRSDERSIIYVKVKVSLEQTMKAQRRSRGIAILFF